MAHGSYSGKAAEVPVLMREVVGWVGENFGVLAILIISQVTMEAETRKGQRG